MSFGMSAVFSSPFIFHMDQLRGKSLKKRPFFSLGAIHSFAPQMPNSSSLDLAK